jgi:hypothetical protein
MWMWSSFFAAYTKCLTLLWSQVSANKELGPEQDVN